MRVAFVNQADLPGLSCRECRELGRLKDGVWLLAPDAVILSGKARLLYFSQADYESAIRQLSATETARVMRRRVDQWSQTAIHDAADYLYRRQKECLALTARCRLLERDADRSAVFDHHFDEGLQLLADLTGEHRYEGVTLRSMLGISLRGHARLHLELVAAGDPSAGQTFRRAGILAALLEEAGDRAYTQSLPDVRLERVVYIEPDDPELKELLVAREVEFAGWRRGVVAPWPVNDLPNLERARKSAAVLYFDRGEFAEDLAVLTRAQLEREFATRMDAGGFQALVKDYLLGLRLEQHLLMRNVLKIARSSPPDVRRKLVPEIKADGRDLLAAMSSRPGTGAGRLEAGNPLLGLETTESNLLRDAVFFEDWAARLERKQLQGLFAEIALRKRSDLARVSGLAGARSPE